jgi:inactive STAND/Effector-associated domain 9
MFDDLRRKDIALEYANLLQEQEACKNQYRSTIDDAQKVVLKRKLDDLNRKIAEIENQLFGKDLSENTNRRQLALKQKLPQIDFKKAIKLVDKILNEFDEYGAAFFLIHDSCNMAGDLFALELKNLLQDETTDLKYYEIAFSLGNRLDEIGFLQGIAGYLGVEEVESQEHYPKVIEKIFNSLENGSIVFVEIRKMDLLDNQESFLSWLVDVFWKALVEKLPLICKLKEIEQIRFIMIVVSDDNIEEECLGLPFFCQEHDFDMCRVLRIPLQDWSEKEIRTWLTKHSGLPTDKISPMAKSIHKSSRGGTPKLICEALKNKLS